MKLKISEVPEPRDGINMEMLEMMEATEISGITKKQQKLITEAYEQAIETIYKNITPLGFSACSLEDNITTDTDINYRSVWALDGSITITGTISLINNDKIFDCQRKTIETLFENTLESGQVPTNVSIDTLSPNYSGIDGVCSIDSGLWTIIAFHDFVKASGDIDFLRKHLKTVGNIMTWLNAHDGNNDSLLEIPEAGDWMNLKGRSYNVLYDEVLWYHANICAGRLYELLGRQKLATKHISRSQVIKNSILANFWPASQLKPVTSQSHQAGYANHNGMYLFAQTTPFGFGWRCDVYANMLAHLFNIVDESKASDIFRFVWGSGGNKPFPVKNIYPAVVTQDPDQRAYYSGNLLNLPNHYHNGGIWPFIGGAWVRSINKLGLRDVALKELHKLAGLNQRGIFNEWEFNEWYHGETGRPMGKAFQAWSASEFIHACHELRIVS
jgi:glycogen debranching enzyme